jgi:hypothetical protein
VYFCIRDDDTSFFTSPDELEQAYGEISLSGPVSLAIIPFCRAGSSRALPSTHRLRWSIHPLHENAALVAYLRERIRDGRFEAMLHGYHHDEPDGVAEFAGTRDLRRRVAVGRRYLEEVLGTPIRVFVPPHNAIGRQGMQAIVAEGLHLAGTGGVRAAWSLGSRRTWTTWLRLRRWRNRGGLGIPWVLDLGDHQELPGVAVTPASVLHENQAILDGALANGSVFCAATHYWELNAPTLQAHASTVGDHLRCLVDRAMTSPRMVWRSVGAIVSDRSLSL